MKIVLGILMVILVLLQLRLWTGTGSLQDISRLEQKIDAQEQENASLQLRNAGLRDEVTELKTGMDAFEERARNELGLIRKGETYFLILEEPKAVAPERGQPQPDSLVVPLDVPAMAESNRDLPPAQHHDNSQHTQ